jgi:hypothetical protein
MSQSATDTWKVCSTCRLAIPFQARYFECSVSTCTRKRTGFFFCSLACWEAHVPTLRHRDAWAVEQTAPSRETWAKQLAEEEADTVAMPATPPPSLSAPRVVPPAPMRAAAPTAPPGPVTLSSSDLPHDVLVVVSKLKAYVKARSGMNTSDGVTDGLSDLVRKWLDQAIRNAAADGRKTVLDRDIPRP